MNENKTLDKLFDQLIEEAANAVADRPASNGLEPEPVIFSPKHDEAMKEIFRHERRKLFMKKMLKNSKKVAILFLVLSFLLGVSISSVDAWRVKFLNFVMDIGQTNSEINFVEDEKTGDTYSSDDITLRYIPEGFKIVDSYSKMNGIYLSFQNGENSFKLQVQEVGSSLSADTENADMKKVKINEKEALYSSNNNTNLLIWHDDTYSYVLSGNIEGKEIFKIAENVKK